MRSTEKGDQSSGPAKTESPATRLRWTKGTHFVNRWRVTTTLLRALGWRDRPSVLYFALLTGLRALCPRPLRWILPSEVWINLRGAKYCLALGQGELAGFLDVWVNWSYERDHSFSPSPNSRVVDLGANVGFFTLRHALAGARVVAVEPNVDARRRLLASVAANRMESRVTVLPYAMGETRTTGWLSTGASTTTGQLVPSASGGSRLCEVRTLPDVFSETGLAKVDLLKLDVEGAEAAILRGAEDVIPDVSRIVLEYHSPELLADVTLRLGRLQYSRVWVDSTIAYFVQAVLLDQGGEITSAQVQPVSSRSSDVGRQA